MKLIDGYYKDWKDSTVEPSRLKESVEKVTLKESGESYDVLIGYRVPLWRLDLRNLNDRVYSTAEAEKVIAKFSKIATVALFDHDDDLNKPSTKNIAAVAKNPTIKDGIMYIDVYIVDEAFEKKFEKILKLGASVGISSVFDGDIDHSGYVFDLELDRWCDIVLNPSYEVFITKDSPRVTSDGSEVLREDFNKEKSLKEETSKETSMPRNLTELRIELSHLIESAKKLENLDDRLKRLKVIEGYIEPSDRESLSGIITSIKEEVDLVESTLKEEKAEKEKKLQEKIESSTALEEEVVELRRVLEEKDKSLKAVEDLSSELKETVNKQKELLEAVKESDGEEKSDEKLEEGCDSDEKQKLYSKELSEGSEETTVHGLGDGADLGILNDKTNDEQPIKEDVASEEIKLKEGIFSGHKCKILEEVATDNGKEFKIELVESKVVLEKIAESAVKLTEKSDDVKDNEIATLQASLRKEKEQNKLLRSQLEKQREGVEGEDGAIQEELKDAGEALPTEDSATVGAVEDPGKVKEEQVAEEASPAISSEEKLPEVNDATVGDVENPGKVKESVKESADSMDHFDEKVKEANMESIKEAVQEIVEGTPSLKAYESQLAGCTTLDQLDHLVFKLNGRLKEDEIQKASLKEDVSGFSFSASETYGEGDDSYYSSLNI